jgi:hypothetical protein
MSRPQPTKKPPAREEPLRGRVEARPAATEEEMDGLMRLVSRVLNLPSAKEARDDDAA